MAESLCDAALTGNLESLREKIAEDAYILDKVLVGCFKGKNPLHMATLKGQAEFVEELLKIEPKLAEVVDPELGTALHIASANGDLKIVEVLLELNPEMCMARDRNGHNPLHIAAMKGKVDVLKKLVQICPRAADVISDRGDTILHLCVNYNQLECLQRLLKMSIYGESVNSKDANGNTILHAAVLGKRLEIVEYLLKNRTGIEVNARNGAGQRAVDMNYFVRKRVRNDEVDDSIGDCLLEAGANLGPSLVKRDLKDPVTQTLMVVASLFATMAFQVGVNPPGGVWQDNSEEHQAGKAILAYQYPRSYLCFMFFNTVGFLVSLSFISGITALNLIFVDNCMSWITPILSLSTIMTTAFAYSYSVIAVSPKHISATVTIIILVPVIFWTVGMIISIPIGVMVTGGQPITNKYWRRLCPSALGGNASWA